MQRKRIRNMKQCPKCGYMNPDDAKFCMNCGSPFPKKRKLLPIIVGVILAIAIIASVPIIFAIIKSSPVVLSASSVQSTLGGKWSVVTNETYLAKYPVKQITIEYANGTNVTVPYPHQIKTYIHEVLMGKMNSTNVTMIVKVIIYTSNITMFHHMFGFGFQFNTNQFYTDITTYDGYTIFYVSSTFPYPHTFVTAVKGNELIQIKISGYSASLQQVESLISDIS
ncbi:zinc ribbon domain-containing protein [Sulfolobus sp. S-194]|nr:zinc ribbon domain-containing protein [Sulfolobus sp. S-194]